MLLEVIVLGLAIGWAAGGKLSRLSGIRLAGTELVIAGFVMQALAPKATAVNSTFGYLLLVGSYLLILAALSLNTSNSAIVLMSLGIFLNFMVIGLNGGMPVKTAIPAGFNDAVHIELNPATRLPWLGDIISWPLPGPLGGIVSIGDILLSAGIFVFIYQGMAYKGKRRAGRTTPNA